MPLYEYRCLCGQSFEKISAIADRGKNVCPVCGQPVMLVIRPNTYRMAEPYRVIDGEGKVIHQSQTIEKAPLQLYSRSGKVSNK